MNVSKGIYIFNYCLFVGLVAACVLVTYNGLINLK